MVEFGGWEMPVQYPTGIIKEHLATRREAGLFDVSHMGRFIIRGAGALKFLQHTLTNNVEALDVRETGAQYTLIPNETGGAVDDAYLYCFVKGEYLLVVNAANSEKDWKHLQTLLKDFNDVELIDHTEDLVMLALQGPMSRKFLGEIIQSGPLPEPIRNAVSTVTIKGSEVKVARTGYTGEPLCFELFASRGNGLMLWDLLLAKGATPIGLGARDTLRLEAGLPLYGNELGQSPDDKEIPIMACPLTKFAVSFSDLKAEFVGRKAVARQFEALSRIISRDYSLISDLPRMIKPIAVEGRGIAREGVRVFKNEKHVGYVTSGTMIPLWVVEGEGLSSVQTDQYRLRSICLAYVDSDIIEDDKLTIEIRGKSVDAVVVPFHLRTDAPPYARPIVFDHQIPAMELYGGDMKAKAHRLLEKTVENMRWRQQDCINLIPSEMTISPMVRLLSVMDPAFRYAEHRESRAFYDVDIFYYQGTEFIGEIELLLEEEMRKFLGCNEVETRLVSGQMANTAVFSAMLDYINRADRKCEPRRIRCVMNNHISKGGHLSAQPMGALRDFVARDSYADRKPVQNRCTGRPGIDR
jgi:aminomethyltransferase